MAVIERCMSVTAASPIWPGASIRRLRVLSSKTPPIFWPGMRSAPPARCASRRCLFRLPACDPSGCTSTWQTQKRRLKAPEAKIAAEGGIPSETRNVVRGIKARNDIPNGEPFVRILLQPLGAMTSPILSYLIILSRSAHLARNTWAAPSNGSFCK